MIPLMTSYMGVKAPKGWKFQEVKDNPDALVVLIRVDRKGDWYFSFNVKSKLLDDYIILNDKTPKYYSIFSSEFATTVFIDISKLKCVKAMIQWAKAIQSLDKSVSRRYDTFRLTDPYTKTEEVFVSNGSTKYDKFIFFQGDVLARDGIGYDDSYGLRAKNLQDAKKKLLIAMDYGKYPHDTLYKYLQKKYFRNLYK